MSEYLEFTWKVNGALTSATSVTLADSTNSYGAKRDDTGEVIIPAGEAMTLGDDLVYRYPLPDGLAGVPISWVACVVYNGVTYRFAFDTIEPATSDIGIPVFEHVVIVGDDKADLRVVAIQGLTTKHGSTLTDRGRLYAVVDQSGEGYAVDVYADMARTRLVMHGEATFLAGRFDLAAQNGSGMSGYAWLESFAARSSAVLIPTFAVDADVLVQPEAAANLPGFDPTYGLAFIHAQQQRVLLLGEIPAAVPWLYPEGSLAAFIPGADGTPMPPLRQIANVDLLRVAQAMLVKAAAAEQNEHIDEWAAIAKAARGRFDATMKRFAAANPSPKDRDLQEDVDTIGLGSFSRG